MSTAIESPPVPAAARPAPSRHGTVLALVPAVVGLAVGAAGAALLAAFGGDGTVRSGAHALSTPASAFDTPLSDISHLDDVAAVTGTPRVAVHARGSDVFVGVGPAGDVERYLAGAAVEEITDAELEPFRLERELHDGARVPAPPETQDFWVASAAGARSADLRWDVGDGAYRVVLMHRDGSRGVDATVRAGLTAPRLSVVAWALVGIGVSLLLTAVTAGVVGARRRTPDLP
jgi:hypothetical protein